MKRIVVDQKVRVGAWVAERVRRSAQWEAYAAIGIENDAGTLIGGAVIEGYVAGARCVMHCAGEGRTWLTREFLFACFDYVFRQLRCKVAVSPVDADNHDCIRFISHLGFVETGRVPEGAGDCDLLIFSMPRRTCRWLDLRRG